MNNLEKEILKAYFIYRTNKKLSNLEKSLNDFNDKFLYYGQKDKRRKKY